jgi:hypothetical protein
MLGLSGGKCGRIRFSKRDRRSAERSVGLEMGSADAAASDDADPYIRYPKSFAHETVAFPMSGSIVATFT